MTLVCVFLRGAADGLNLVVPHAEDEYYRLRPTLAVARPDDKRADVSERSLPLDERFALHPNLRQLLPLYESGELAVVHAVGSDDQTRSHFEAQDRMEHAGATAGSAGSGWIARHLLKRPGPPPSGLGAVAIGTSMPESLRGAPGAAALTSIDEYRLGGKADPAFARGLGELYSAVGAQAGIAGRLAMAGRDTLGTLDRLMALGDEGPAASYPEGSLGRALREVARLIRGDVGLEVASVDHGGWDTHFVQPTTFPGLVSELGHGLAAFRADLGARMRDVVVVVMTEFGRRAYENSSLGTDHGRAGVMFALGGGVRGGQVVCDWPGLARPSLEQPGDLRVTLDYRHVLAELCQHCLGTGALDVVFPGLRPQPVGIFRSP